MQRSFSLLSPPKTVDIIFALRYNRGMKCFICPRKCGADRDNETGFCGEKSLPRVAYAAPHYYEEPVISGTKGSGAVFFSGCNLRCCYCQNSEINCGGVGEEMTDDRLYAEFCRLAELGVHNINLVTAAHFAPQIVPALSRFKANYALPVVYNSSGYESVSALKMLDGLVDVYLPDYKYVTPEIALRLSRAADYPSVARAAIAEMLRQQPRLVFEREGEPCSETDEGALIKKGVIIRHLVLPSYKNESIAVLRDVAENFSGAAVSVMRQYTPQFNRGAAELNRRVTSYEYNCAVNEAVRQGLRGFMQGGASASAKYTPDFTGKNDK